MKLGERIETTITSLDEKGRGIGSFSGREVVVAGALPGERVTGVFAGKDKGRVRLAEVEILTASPDRVRPECQYFGKCGGCSLQHLRYEAQVTFKRGLIESAFREALIDLPLAGFTAAAAPLRYRNRMDFVFGPAGELGLRMAGRWDACLDLETCLLMSPEADECRRLVAAWARSTGLPFWDGRANRGFFRYLVLRESRRTGERMATLISAGPLPETAAQGLVEALKPLCTTVYHGINAKVSDTSMADELHLLHGSPRLHETVSGVTYAIHPNSFFQTNTEMAERLLEHVRGLVLAGEHRRLLDLYCGSGFFSLALSKDVESGIGIELDAFAIKSARANAELNAAANLDFRAEPAELLTWAAAPCTERCGAAPDVAVVDPPRAGLHPKVRACLLAAPPPRLIYVSCNPKALALDLKELFRAYEPASAEGFDLFPQTPHVETVVELKLK